MSRDQDYIKLIHSKGWLNTRRNYLTAHPLCEVCRRKEKLTPASEVHHKTPVETGHSFEEKKRLLLDVTNLLAVCRECHLQEHRLLKSASNEEKQRRLDEHKGWFRRVFLDDADPGG